jgi:hypothetical protein
MSKQFFYGLFIFLAFSGTVALSANVPDTLNVTPPKRRQREIFLPLFRFKIH